MENSPFGSAGKEGEGAGDIKGEQWRDGLMICLGGGGMELNCHNPSDEKIENGKGWSVS